LYSAINTELSTPDIEGIYETQVPLMMRALACVGAVCRITPARANNIQYRFDANDVDISALQICTPQDGYSYMMSTGGQTTKKTSIRHMYLYAYAQDTRATVALCTPATGVCTVWLLDRARVEHTPNAARMYADAHAKKANAQADILLPKSDVTWNVHSVTSWRDVFSGVQRALRAYTDGRYGATMIGLHAASGQSVYAQLMAGVPQLAHFPIVPMPLPVESHVYSTATLDWPRVAIQRMIFHFLNSILYIDVSLRCFVQIYYVNLLLASRWYGTLLSITCWQSGDVRR
jgi:DNA polymerase epsilon subunit 1